MRAKDRVVSTGQLNRDPKLGVETCHSSHDYSISNDVQLASAILGVLRPWSMGQRKTIAIECWCWCTLS